jgi:hypothetical protein
LRAPLQLQARHNCNRPTCLLDEQVRSGVRRGSEVAVGWIRTTPAWACALLVHAMRGPLPEPALPASL